jgi:hypothetical protein
LTFRQEQNQGWWIEHVNPLAVFYLPDQNTTAEVQYGPRTGYLRDFGAIIWLPFGSVDGNEILTRWATWPIWHPAGGMDPFDLDSILASLWQERQEKLRGGLTIRPAAVDGASATRPFLAFGTARCDAPASRRCSGRSSLGIHHPGRDLVDGQKPHAEVGDHGGPAAVRRHPRGLA